MECAFGHQGRPAFSEEQIAAGFGGTEGLDGIPELIWTASPPMSTSMRCSPRSHSARPILTRLALLIHEALGHRRAIMGEPDLLNSCDVGGSSDPAALAVALVQRRDRLTKARVLHLEVKPFVVSPTDHIDLVRTNIDNLALRLAAQRCRSLSTSATSAITSLLANAVPRQSLVVCGSRAASNTPRASLRWPSATSTACKRDPGYDAVAPPAAA